MFKADNIKFKIIENDTIFNVSEYKQNENISNLLTKIRKIDIDTLSISEAYNFIEEIKEIALKIS